ncbi:hypothetical protein LCGC14_2538700, partial [marine sediment metagenome]
MSRDFNRLCKQIQKLEQGIARDFLIIGEILCEIQEMGWTSDYDSFGDVVANNFD